MEGADHAMANYLNSALPGGIGFPRTFLSAATTANQGRRGRAWGVFKHGALA